MAVHTTLILEWAQGTEDTEKMMDHLATCGFCQGRLGKAVAKEQPCDANDNEDTPEYRVIGVAQVIKDGVRGCLNFIPSHPWIDREDW